VVVAVAVLVGVAVPVGVGVGLGGSRTRFREAQSAVPLSVEDCVPVAPVEEIDSSNRPIEKPFPWCATNWRSFMPAGVPVTEAACGEFVVCGTNNSMSPVTAFKELPTADVLVPLSRPRVLTLPTGEYTAIVQMRTLPLAPVV
jgi:hypothetical protein